ncbi:alpha/beta hydrolase [Nocardia panacis]|uniref:Alpha/beta hydrolase n=1 Tax=Nocardia panacis TaxID=2340916 RepID=A0A3A4KHA8_9NOCA|nr:alpha/beta hydrolase [Nocardia panacis]RJO72922.1 alpha/beta hydrolase [Nocardia panacis]
MFAIPSTLPDTPGRAQAIVALPGTGSDADFARRAFEPACTARGFELIAVRPDPRGVVAGYRAALDAAAASGPILVTGISLGAAVAVEWAAEHPRAAIGVVAALPAWTGPDTAQCPAALSAAYTARQLRERGLEEVVTQLRSSSPPWLARALTQSWRAQWPDLPDALEEAADYKWPGVELLGSVRVPVAVVGAVDDPVHPISIAEQWAALLPHSALHRITLDELGADPGVIGRLGLESFHESR